MCLDWVVQAKRGRVLKMLETSPLPFWAVSLAKWKKGGKTVSFSQWKFEIGLEEYLRIRD